MKGWGLFLLIAERSAPLEPIPKQWNGGIGRSSLNPRFFEGVKDLSDE